MASPTSVQDSSAEDAQRSRKKRLSRSATAAFALALAVGGIAPISAQAAPAYNRSVSYREFMSHDVLMGAFFTSYGDHTDTLYLSTDGKQFDELGVAYRDATPNNPNDDTSTLGKLHHTLGDPSIMYHNGAFWMLSGWNRHDGKFWPSIGVSQDGKTWSYPESITFGGKKYGGISLSPAARFGTDTVAPEWFVDNKGQVYIIFCAGYFGLFHGQPYQDKMVPYLVKVNELRYDGPSPTTRMAVCPRLLSAPVAPSRFSSPSPPMTALTALLSRTMTAPTTSPLSVTVPTTKFGATRRCAPPAGSSSIRMR